MIVFIVLLLIFLVNLAIYRFFKNNLTDNVKLVDYINTKFNKQSIKENPEISSNFLDMDEFNNI